MVKQKKKKNLSERVNHKTQGKKSSNPFEVHVNRQKFNVLGRQLKTDRGLPGVAKAKALKKRKETLLQEYKIQNKNNKFFDRRIGEKNSAMTHEDRIIARFSAERMKTHKRKMMFNLAEDEVLTHKGQSIAEIEKFEDPIVSDDEDYYDAKGLDANFVEEANFGGGTLRENKTSRAAIIDQLIAESKKRKAERQMAKEQTLQQTEELDAEWKELLPYVNMGKQEEVIEKKDPYDVLMNELKFEPRGTPSNKLKSEAEIAEEEARKLKELEEERLMRMRGEEPNSSKQMKHRSADDLDDGFEIEEDNFELTYDKDGNPVGLDKLNDDDLIGKKKEEENDDFESEKGGEDGSDDESAEDDDDSEEITNDGDDSKEITNDDNNSKEITNDDNDSKEITNDDNDSKEITNDDNDSKEITNDDNDSKEITNDSEKEDTKSEDVEEEQADNDEDNADDSDDESDKLSDLLVLKEDEENNEIDSEDETEGGGVSKNVIKEDEKTDDIKTEINKSQSDANESSEVVCVKEETVVDKTGNEKKIKEKKKVSFSRDITLLTYTKEPKDIPEKKELANEEIKKLMKENAHNDIPFAIEAPTDYEEFTEIFKNRTPEQQSIIVERIIKCNHPRLNEKNKEKLDNLMAFLLQHLNDANENESWLILDRLTPHLFDLTQFNPHNAAFCLGEVISEKRADYLKRKYKYPTSETFLFLKLVPMLFPTSDKRHQVTTPSFVFICEMLRQCNVRNRRTISTGLFLVSLFTEYICLSKRVMPEALNFLTGIISMASPQSDLPISFPFKKEHKFLFLQESLADRKEVDLAMPISDLILKGSKIDDDFRIRSIYCALKLLHILAENYEEIAASKLLFISIKKHLDKLEINKYPTPVKEAYDQLLEILERIFDKEMVPLMVEAKKPKALRLYEPSIQPVYENKKKAMSGDQAEHSKLLHKYKQEMKGALREIRRDRSFIANLKFKEQAASDAERKRKVQEIYSWGAQQEGEFKKLKRKKK